MYVLGEVADGRARLLIVQTGGDELWAGEADWSNISIQSTKEQRCLWAAEELKLAVQS